MDILITSYDLLKRDIANYENTEFFCEILDEAQFIKRPEHAGCQGGEDDSCGNQVCIDRYAYGEQIE